MCVHGAHKHMLFHVNKLTYIHVEQSFGSIVSTKQTHKGTQKAAEVQLEGGGAGGPEHPLLEIWQISQPYSNQGGKNLPLTLMSTHRI